METSGRLAPAEGPDLAAVLSARGPPAVTDDQAKQKYPAGWKTLKPYLRIVPQPK